MPALSPMMISILEGSLRAGATSAIISKTAGTARLVQGSKPLGQGPLPPGMFDPLASELRALGGRDGARSPVSVHSPVGPLQLFVEIDPDELRIFFARDSNEAAAEAAFGQVMARMVSLGGDRVLCASGQLSFLKGKEVLAVAPVDEETRTLLVAHGRSLVPGGEKTGSSVLLSDRGPPRTLRVALSESGVAFSLGS